MFLPATITLRPGDSGDYVSELQRRLAQRDLLGEANINGYYDGITTNAVKAFQSLNGLAVDGIAGPETIRRLLSLADTGNRDEGGSAATEEEEEKKREAEALNRHRKEFLLSEMMRDEMANDAIREMRPHKDDVPLDELRAKSLEKGHGREGHALWSGQDKGAEKAAGLEKFEQQQQLLMRQTQIEHQQMERAQMREQQRDHQLDMTREQLQARTPLDALRQEGRQDASLQQAEGRDTHSKERLLALEKGAELPGQQQQKQTALTQDIRLDPNRLGPDRAFGLQPGREGQQGSLQNGREPGRERDALGRERQTDALGRERQTDGLGRERQPERGREREGWGREREMNRELNGRDRLNGRERDIERSDRADLRRTESRLDPPSRRESREEGVHLHDRGVRDIGMPRGARLGELNPSPTPQPGGREREAAVGAG